MASLSLRSNLRILLIQNDAVKVFTEVIEGSHPDFVTNTPAHRLAAKGLMNLALAKKEIRHQIISALPQTMTNIVDGTCDQVVASYLNALVSS